ncbi:hypothetical protein KC331_g1787 [Hortaea werneckii]|nr:hypothetical protein KC331_g1787 [Hortaea werneckii]KAI7721205.1 hypothetical protein KC353_g1542 [Hortaea werneckii]
MKSSRLAKNTRDGLLNGTRSPQNQREQDWLQRRRAGPGQQSAEQLAHDQHWARVRREHAAHDNVNQVPVGDRAPVALTTPPQALDCPPNVNPDRWRLIQQAGEAESGSPQGDRTFSKTQSSRQHVQCTPMSARECSDLGDAYYKLLCDLGPDGELSMSEAPRDTVPSLAVYPTPVHLFGPASTPPADLTATKSESEAYRSSETTHEHLQADGKSSKIIECRTGKDAVLVAVEMLAGALEGVALEYDIVREIRQHQAKHIREADIQQAIEILESEGFVEQSTWGVHRCVKLLKPSGVAEWLESANEQASSFKDGSCPLFARAEDGEAVHEMPFEPSRGNSVPSQDRFSPRSENPMEKRPDDERIIDLTNLRSSSSSSLSEDSEQDGAPPPSASNHAAPRAKDAQFDIDDEYAAGAAYDDDDDDLSGGAGFGDSEVGQRGSPDPMRPQQDDNHRLEVERRQSEKERSKREFGLVKAKLMTSRQDGFKESPFDQLMLEVLEFYENSARRKYRDPADPDKTGLDVLSARVAIHGRSLPYLGDVLAIDPDRNDKWATDELLKFHLENTGGSIPNGHFLIESPALVHFFANKEIPAELSEEYFHQTYESNAQALRDHQEPNFLASDMPSGCRHVHFVYNPSGNHWVYFRLDVNEEKTIGEITLFDSLDGPMGESRKRALQDLPQLAAHMAQRPALGWEEVQWQDVRESRCAIQANSDDCGFFATDAVRRALQGVPQANPVSKVDRLVFGEQLRWRFLSELHSFIFGRDTEEPTRALANRHDPNGRPCIPCRTDSTPCNLGRPCSACDRREDVACSYQSADDPSEPELPQSNDASRAFDAVLWSIRAAIGDVLGQAGLSSGQSLIDAVEKAKKPTSPELQINAADIQRVLYGSPAAFYRVSGHLTKMDLSDTFGLNPTFCGAIDRRTIQSIFTSGKPYEDRSDDIDLKVDILVPVVRHSSGYSSNDGYAKACDRATEIVTAHHARFSASERFPRRVTTAEEVDDALAGMQAVWTPHICEPGTSRRRFLDSPATRDRAIVSLLEEANRRAKEDGRSISIAFLGVGWDGLSTDNASWHHVKALFPDVDLRLTLLINENAIPCPEHGRLDEFCHAYWLHFDIKYLAQLSDRSVAEPPLHLCSRTELEDTAGLEENNPGKCQACVSTGVLAMRNSWCFQDPSQSIYVEDVRSFYAHAQGLLAFALVDHLKLDYSLFNGVYTDSHRVARGLNPTACRLVSYTRISGRNVLQLPTIHQRVCERCGAQGRQFVRGETSPVALRCRTCPIQSAPELRDDATPGSEQNSDDSAATSADDGIIVSKASVEAKPSEDDIGNALASMEMRAKLCEEFRRQKYLSCPYCSMKLTYKNAPGRLIQHLKMRESRTCDQCGCKTCGPWRLGPKGPATLCNSCGSLWYKLRKKHHLSVSAKETRQSKSKAAKASPRRDVNLEDQISGEVEEDSDERSSNQVSDGMRRSTRHRKQPPTYNEAGANVETATAKASSEGSAYEDGPRRTPHRRTKARQQKGQLQIKFSKNGALTKDRMLSAASTRAIEDQSEIRSRDRVPEKPVTRTGNKKRKR